MTDVNIELFKKTSPDRKVELIRNLTQAELSGVSKTTILRIIKEAGRRNPGTRNYELYIYPDRRTGNQWNSEIEGIWLNKGKLYVIAYIQLDHTDCEKTIPSDDFFKEGVYRGAVIKEDHYGNPQTHYYVYDEKDKADVLRSICLEYSIPSINQNLTIKNLKHYV